MKYDDIERCESYDYEHDSVTRGKIGKKRRYNPLDIAIVGSICGVVISTTVLVSRLMSSGLMSSLAGAIG